MKQKYKIKTGDKILKQRNVIFIVRQDLMVRLIRRKEIK